MDALSYTKPASAGISEYIGPSFVSKRTLEFAADTSRAAGGGFEPGVNFFESPSKGGPDKNLYTKSEIEAVAK